MSRANLVFYKGNWYHPNFFKRRETCLKKANYTCCSCGKKQGDSYISNQGRTSHVVLQAHHPFHDRVNPRAILIALCKPCHMKADGPEHGRKRRQFYHAKRREAQLLAGQLELPLKKLVKGAAK